MQISKAEPEPLIQFCKLAAAKLAANSAQRIQALKSPEDGISSKKRIRKALGFIQLSPLDELQQ